MGCWNSESVQLVRVARDYTIGETAYNVCPRSKFLEEIRCSLS